MGVPSARHLLLCSLAACAVAAGVGALAQASGGGPLTASAALAPGPLEWDTTIREAEVRLDRAEALATAAQRLQNAWAGALQQTARPCADPDVAPLGARIVPFAEAWRDAVQAARVQADRVARLEHRVTIAPLLDDQASERVAAIQARVAEQVQAWGEYHAWHARHAGASLAACGEVVVGPGLADPRPWRAPQTGRAVAVLARKGGTVCPEGVPAVGQVLLVQRSACWSPGPCDCSPGPVEPGAVLGQPPPAPPTTSELTPIEVDIAPPARPIEQ